MGTFRLGALVALALTLPRSVFAAPAAGRDGRDIELSLVDAVKSALAHNPDVIQLELDAEISNLEVSRQLGLFEPVLKIGLFDRHEKLYATDASQGQSPTKTVNTLNLDSSLQARTSFGGLWSLDFRANRLSDTEPSGFQGPLVRYRPLYTEQVSVRYTQALARDGGFAANRGLVDRASLDAEVSRADKREHVERLTLEVVSAYWDLVVRRERVRIAQANVAEATKLRDLVERQVRGGQAPKSDITQADVTVTERQQTQQLAELAVVDGERALLDLTYLAGDQLAWNDSLVLTDRPTSATSTASFDSELAIAFANRPEFKREKSAVASAQATQKIATNQKRLRVDAYVEAGLAGFAGENVVADNLALATPPALLQGALAKSFDNLASFQAPYVEVGLSIELPIGNKQRDAAARQAELQVKREQAVDVKSLVSHDVRAAFQRLAIAARRVATATENQRLADANVIAQDTRYRGGGGLLFDVIRAQEDQARARAQSVLAAAEQEVTLMQLEQARGTLLAHFGLKP